jgi:biofilm PGA synthesis N-glycosyltransferase PgaC
VILDAFAFLPGVCLLFYCGLVLFSALNIWARSRRESNVDVSELLFISVVIPARNEEQNIEACLRSVLAQSYPHFEVIMINDHSTDQTRAIADSIAGEDERLRVFDLTTSDTIAYKKAAITQGVSAAKGDIIVQTDADCEVGTEWLGTIAGQFARGYDFVSAPVLLNNTSSLFSSLQSLEYQGLVMMGGGSLLGGFPNMANGANMAYRKSAFEKVHGFAGVSHVASGDDELLLQKIHKAGMKLDFLLDQRAIVRTKTMDSFAAFKAQRLRWVSKARAYDNRWINLVQLISFAAFMAFPVWILMGKWEWLLAGFFGKMMIDVTLMLQSARFFRTFRLLWLLPVLELVYIPYVLWVGIAGNFIKQYRWKDRTVL